MPSTEVTPTGETGSPAAPLWDGPSIGGTVFPRPNGVDESPELVRSDVELANGSLRSYTNGVRFAVTLSWSRMTGETLAALRAATRSPFVAYTHIDGTSYMVKAEQPSANAIAGTHPTRYAVNLSLVEQGPRR